MPVIPCTPKCTPNHAVHCIQLAVIKEFFSTIVKKIKSLSHIFVLSYSFVQHTQVAKMQTKILFCGGGHATKLQL
jgi:hypothetical protein